MEVVHLDLKNETGVVQVEVSQDKMVHPHMIISCNIEVEQVQIWEVVEMHRMVVHTQQEH